MEGKNNWTHNEKVINILESKELYDFFEGLFGKKVRSFDFKWLRAVPKNVYAGVHVDWVYMG